MELLATAHVNRPGVSLWSNRWIFGGDASSQDTIVPLSALPEQKARRPLVRMAMMPVSEWNCSYGSTLKERYEALKPQQDTAAAPFFLPPLVGTTTRENPDGLKDPRLTEPPPKRQRRETAKASEFIEHLKVRPFCLCHHPVHRQWV